MIIKEFQSVRETQNYAAHLANEIQEGTVLALYGNLGTGKTTFTQGFAQGLGIHESVGSPTFKLVSEYQGDQTTLFHVDCYRLESPEEFLNIGGENLLNPVDGITIIEWSERINLLFDASVIKIEFKRIESKPTYRLVTLSGLRKEK